MRPANCILILSDEHNRAIMGASGDPFVRTPNMDALAARGVRFSSAYAPSPVCVPVRASLATGRYVHRIGAWDSTCGYTGAPPSWAARLREAGHRTASIGKLHYRRDSDDAGFSEVHLPMHVIDDGQGITASLLRDPPVVLAGSEVMAEQIGAGETGYTKYDRQIAVRACEWIADAATRKDDAPWVLQLGFVAPHYPLVAPDAFYDLYGTVELPEPLDYAQSERPRHPALDAMRRACPYDDYFNPERIRTARRSYYGLVSFLDHHIGLILSALEAAGLRDNTRVIYTSDHGEHLGQRGLWGKSTMYEESAGVPMLMAGPGLPEGEVCNTPVSLIDLFPTLIKAAGQDMSPEDTGLPGRALDDVLAEPDPERSVFSEYHDWASITGSFMLRKGRWKLIEHVGHAPQLFDLQADPLERCDRAPDPETRNVLEQMQNALRNICDPEVENARALYDQAAKIARLGGRDAILAKEVHAFTPTMG